LNIYERTTPLAILCAVAAATWFDAWETKAILRIVYQLIKIQNICFVMFMPSSERTFLPKVLIIPLQAE
jgi:hypothetical protein